MCPYMVASWGGGGQELFSKPAMGHKMVVVSGGAVDEVGGQLAHSFGLGFS